MAVLGIGKGVKALSDIESGLDVGAQVVLDGIGIIVFVQAIGSDVLTKCIIPDIGKVTKVVALELLQRYAAAQVKTVHGVNIIPDYTISVLLQTFLAYKIGLLYGVGAIGPYGIAVGIQTVGQTVLAYLVLVSELLIVAVTVGVVGCERG